VTKAKLLKLPSYRNKTFLYIVIMFPVPKVKSILTRGKTTMVLPHTNGASHDFILNIRIKMMGLNVPLV